MTQYTELGGIRNPSLVRAVQGASGLPGDVSFSETIAFPIDRTGLVTTSGFNLSTANHQPKVGRRRIRQISAGITVSANTLTPVGSPFTGVGAGVPHVWDGVQANATPPYNNPAAWTLAVLPLNPNFGGWLTGTTPSSLPTSHTRPELVEEFLAGAMFRIYVAGDSLYSEVALNSIFDTKTFSRGAIVDILPDQGAFEAIRFEIFRTATMPAATAAVDAHVVTASDVLAVLPDVTQAWPAVELPYTLRVHLNLNWGK